MIHPDPAMELLDPFAMLEALETIDEVSTNLINGEDASTFAKIADAVKRRNELLSATDWLVVGDSPLTDSEELAIRAWRQELRDAPQGDEWRDPSAPGFLNVPPMPETKYTRNILQSLGYINEDFGETGEIESLSREEHPGHDIGEYSATWRDVDGDPGLNAGLIQPEPKTESESKPPEE